MASRTLEFESIVFTMRRLTAAIRAWARDLKEQLLTLWFCRAHPDTPVMAKILAAMVVAYAFSPIDLIPDFIPVLGYLDDVILVPLGIYIVIRLIPTHVLADGRAKADAWIAASRARPQSKVAAAMILVFWLALALGIGMFAWARWT